MLTSLKFFSIAIFTLVFVEASKAQAPGKTIVLKFIVAFPEADASWGSLSNPQALAIDPEGQVYVADTGNHRIVKFDRLGNVLQSAGGFGWEREQFDRPLDLTVKTGLDLFVADYNNERIERYDLKLNYISSFYSDNALPSSLQFGFPSGVDISRHGEIFIVDDDHNRVLKLDKEGRPDLGFGDFNWGEGQLYLPARVEVSPTDQVYVSDQKANQIVVFDYYGNFVARFGGDVLLNPTGLAFAADGKLYAADTGHHQIAVFDKRRQLIFRWGARGSQTGAFDQPADVAIYKNKIYVLDSGNARIQVFEISENSANLNQEGR